MKEFVVGSPYTTETELTENDPFLILACDGVSIFYTYLYLFLNIFSILFISFVYISYGMFVMIKML
jgi:protein phosphatase PTC1